MPQSIPFTRRLPAAPTSTTTSPLGQIASVIATENGLTLDITKAPDEYLYPVAAPPPS